MQGFVVGALGMAQVDEGVGIPVGGRQGFLGKAHEPAFPDHRAGEDPRTFRQDGVFGDLPDKGFGAFAPPFAVLVPFHEDIHGGALGGAIAHARHGLSAFQSRQQQRRLQINGIHRQHEDGLMHLALGAAGQQLDKALGLVDPAGGADGFGGGVEGDGAEAGDGAVPAHRRGLRLGLGPGGIDDRRRGRGRSPRSEVGGPRSEIGSLRAGIRGCRTSLLSRGGGAQGEDQSKGEKTKRAS